MFPPPKPKEVSGSCEVSSSSTGQVYTVDLDALTCDCKFGQPWRWSKNRWTPNSLCNHKLKALASLCEHSSENEKLRDYYDEELGKRYNAFEAVSAFHKELRRGDVEASIYWANAIVPHRGRHGVVAYMRGILFEETRDINLVKYILKVASKGKSVGTLEMQRAVHRFCLAPKKWELPWRHDIFLNEMRGYKKLASKYGYAVAGHRDIIDAKETPFLRKTLLEGFATGDPVLLQMGLKGLYKSKSSDHDHMKIDIFNTLIEVYNDEHPNAFEHDESYAESLQGLINSKIRNHGGVKYHEINALADALSGEPGLDHRATVAPGTHKMIVNYPRVRRVPLGQLSNVPLYAHDNHTWGGKAKMKTYFAQLNPGAVQKEIDFRMCGAYMGVAWRTLAFKQHATIDCKWGDVTWEPKWLWGHLNNMWY